MRSKLPALLLLVVAISSSTTAVRAQDADKLRHLQGQSDKFFDKVDMGDLPPNNEWSEQRESLKTLAKALPAKETIAHTEIYRRQAIVEMVLSSPKGSEEAHTLFVKAKETLKKLNDEGRRPADYANQMAIIQSYLADNLLMLEKEPETVEAFREAIKLTVVSSYAGTFPELKVRVRSADLAFMRQRYDEIIEVVPRALVIYKKLADAQAGVDPEVVRNMMWYLAIAKSERGRVAEADFDLFLTTFAGKFNSHDLAEAYRQKAINIARQAPKEEGEQRTAALKKAVSIAETAKASIPSPKDKTDKLERYHVIVDLGMLRWRLFEREAAIIELEEALALGEEADGKLSPVLMVALKPLRDISQALGRDADVAKYKARILEIETEVKKAMRKPA